MNTLARCSLFTVLTAAIVSCTPSGPQKSDYLLGYERNNGPTGAGAHHPPPPIPDDNTNRAGDNVTGPPLIKISRAQQKAYFYKGNVLVGVSKISSGNEDHGTPPGRYKIIEKDADHHSSAYGCFKDKATGAMINDNVDIRTDKIPPGAVYYPAPMPNFMRFSGGMGMHTGYLPGYAASHGCIRMPDHMSKHFYDNVQLGTPVIIE